MLAKTDMFMKSEMFDPATFLYCEEPILSERFSRKGFKTFYYGGVSVIHDHGYTARRELPSIQIQKIDFSSQMYYFKQYRHVSDVVMWLARVSFSVYEKLWFPIISFLIRARKMVNETN